MKKNRQSVFVLDDEKMDTSKALDAASQGQAKCAAEQRLFNVINWALSNVSRRGVYRIMMEIVRKWVCVATLEELRAMVIQIEEDLGI